MTEKIERRGGKREGSGRKPVNPLVRKAMPTFRMEKWFLDYIRGFDDPADTIMRAVCDMHGIDRDSVVKGKTELS